MPYKANEARRHKILKARYKMIDTVGEFSYSAPTAICAPLRQVNSLGQSGFGDLPIP
jgi:hypothetical protein